MFYFNDLLTKTLNSMIMKTDKIQKDNLKFKFLIYPVFAFITIVTESEHTKTSGIENYNGFVLTI